MSYTIENLKFTIFGSGYDGTNNDSGTGGDIDPPTPPSPPMEGYLFRYGQIRPMEQYGYPLNSLAMYPVDLSLVTYTGGLCRFKLPALSRSGTLPSLASIKAWVRTVTNKNGGSAPNAHVSRIVPISRTDTGHNIIGLICFYMNDNILYKKGMWVYYDTDLGRWDIVNENPFTLSYTDNDTTDDNSMTFSILNDGEYFKFAYHHTNPQADNFVGDRIPLADYDFYYWS